MKILITGNAGMLGHAVADVFKEHQLILTDIIDLDVRFWDIVKAYFKLYPELVIHLAAETDLEYCEKYPAQAYFTNHTGTLNMCLFAECLNIPIIYISTAGIFNGELPFYTEDNQPCPLNHYGRSKYYGELALKPYNKTYIFRAGWMMGGGIYIDKKFVNKVFKQIQAGKKDIYVLNDIFGSPTYTYDLAKTIKAIIEANAPFGIYNAGGNGICTRYDVAEVFIEYLGLSSKINLHRVYGDFVEKEFPCPRSKNEVLDNTKLELMGLSRMRDWRETLKEYTEKEYKCLLP